MPFMDFRTSCAQSSYEEAASWIQMVLACYRIVSGQLIM